jgi:hypothetical protein
LNPRIFDNHGSSAPVTNVICPKSIAVGACLVPTYEQMRQQDEAPIRPPAAGHLIGEADFLHCLFYAIFASVIIGCLSYVGNSFEVDD